jgi:hypothetical protein
MDTKDSKERKGREEIKVYTDYKKKIIMIIMNAYRGA